MEMEVYAKAAAFLGAAFAMGVGAIGPSIGQGLIGTKACETMGKYPESADKVRTTMLISMTIVESSALYSFLIALLLVYFNK